VSICVPEWQKRKVLTRLSFRRGEHRAGQANSTSLQEGHTDMQINLQLQPLIALIAGVLILVAPRILNYVVAIYLILLGVLGLFPNLLR
jgi:Protein of unknown function (DUF3096)